ncbi:phosphoglycerate mutase family domain protein [Thermoascus aurantiacus ATCC 26904]
MGKPRMIILIRHAQSEGNKNREIHQTVPDHRVKLTPEGHKQALEAGRRLRALLRPDDTLHFFTSPYRRARETTDGILQSLTSDDPSPSPFPRHTIKVYEEPRLREQDFGNFQPCSAEMERMWQERADYGHFFYRIPNGESAADAYDRVSGFNETLWRLFGEEDFASVCVLVTHGLMTRIFLMKWYHWSVEYFEDLRNVNHCEFVIMEKNPDNGKYVLKTKLRTWSELRKEKELEWARERAAKGLPPAPAGTSSDSPVPSKRKWGGCPNGCNHAQYYKSGRKRSVRYSDGNEETDDATRDENSKSRSSGSTTETTKTKRSSLSAKANLTIAIHKPESIDDILSSPDATPSYISLAALTHPRPPYTPSVFSSEEDRPRQPPKSAECSETSAAGQDKSSSGLSPLRPDTDDNNRSPASSRGIELVHLGGRDCGGSQSGANSIVTLDEEGDHPIESLQNPAQEIENDGDDEGSGERSSRRARPHGKGMTNALGDRDDGERRSSSDQAQQEKDENDGREQLDSLELERKRDQSLRGSVY